MPKELLIIRHAKSDWGDPTLKDRNRPLNDRGNKNAPEMAKRLLAKGLIPQQLVSSSALRAVSTAQYFAEVFGIDKKDILLKDEAYEAFPWQLLEIINEMNDKSDLTAFFGHNPGMTYLVQQLCNDKNFWHLPTCGVVLIRFPFKSWSDVVDGSGELIFFDFPKNQQSV